LVFVASHVELVVVHAASKGSTPRVFYCDVYSLHLSFSLPSVVTACSAGRVTERDVGQVEVGRTILPVLDMDEGEVVGVGDFEVALEADVLSELKGELVDDGLTEFPFGRTRAHTQQLSKLLLVRSRFRHLLALPSGVCPLWEHEELYPDLMQSWIDPSPSD